MRMKRLSCLGTFLIMLASQMSALPLSDKDKEQIREQIHQYLATDIRLKKWFLIHDEKTHEILRLKFDLLPSNIREETINKNERTNSVQVTIGIFADENGKKLSVNFYLEWRAPAGDVGKRENWWTIEKIAIDHSGERK